MICDGSSIGCLYTSILLLLQFLLLSILYGLLVYIGKGIF